MICLLLRNQICKENGDVDQKDKLKLCLNFDLNRMMGKRLCGWWWKSDVEGFFNQKMLSRENICCWPEHFLLQHAFLQDHTRIYSRRTPHEIIGGLFCHTFTRHAFSYICIHNENWYFGKLFFQLSTLIFGRKMIFGITLNGLSRLTTQREHKITVMKIERTVQIDDPTREICFEECVWCLASFLNEKWCFAQLSRHFEHRKRTRTILSHVTT